MVTQRVMFSTRFGIKVQIPDMAQESPVSSFLCKAISNLTILIPYIDSIVRLRSHNVTAEDKAAFSLITVEIREEGDA